MQFWHPCCNFSAKRLKYSLNVQKVIKKNVSLLKVHLLPQMHTHRLHFWQRQRKTLAKGQNLSLNVQNWQKISFFKFFFSSKCSYGHVDCSFNNCAKKVWQKAKFFLFKVQNCWKSKALSEFLFLKMFLWTHWIHFWNKFAERFSIKGQNFSFKVRKFIKYFFH